MNKLMSIVPASMLRAALGTDAAVSGGCGALQLAGGAGLAAALGLPEPLMQATGLFLVAYALLLVALATRVRLHAAWVALIVVGNLAWALACAASWVLLAPGAFGAAWLALQALATVAFAAWQFAGWRDSAPAAAASPLGLRGA